MVEKITVKADEFWRFRLDEHNPRHEPQSQQQDIIDYLTANEDVVPLSEDLVAQGGLSPLERFGAVRSGDFLVVVEGNRRICSLMLLADPELAPAKYRARIRQAAHGWKPELVELDVAVFDKREDADPWIERRHQGALGGAGLKQWSVVAKGRHFGTSDNLLALQIMRDAVARDVITEEQGKRRVVTTVRRFTDKETFRRGYLGITTGRNDENYITELDDDVLTDRLRQFFGELFIEEPTVNSRMSAREIAAWVDERLASPSSSGNGKPSSDEAAAGPDSDRSDSDDAGAQSASAASGAGKSANGASSQSDDGTPLPAAPPKVSRPASPASRSFLVDGHSFPDSSIDPLRQYFIYELARIRKDTPLAATLVARVLLESIYLDLWEMLPRKGRESDKLHIKVQSFLPVIERWDLDRKEKAGRAALLRSTQNSGMVLSPAAMGAAAHGSELPAWDNLVKEWDVLLPIIRRIMKHVETAHGQDAP